MEFKKKNIASVKGMKYDHLFKEFEKPGDTLEFSEDVISKQTASQIAVRMTLLSKGKKTFHSFYNKAEAATNVRWRLPDELGDKSDGKDEEEPKSEKEPETSDDELEDEEDPFAVN